MSDINHSNSFHLTYNSLNDAVDEAMKYLEPPSHEEPLTVESVARAYTILQQAHAECHNNNHGEQVNVRFHQIKSILNKNNESWEHKDDWMQQHADLYRALLLSSFLWLELAGGDDELLDSQGTTILQSSVEKCLLLLQVLHTANHGTALPESRHVLLQAVLDEPLVPLDKQERQYSYILQARTTKWDTNAHNDALLINDEEFITVATMDRKELIRQEKELLKLASKPVPALTRNSVVAPSGIIDHVNGSVKEESQNGLVHCGSITYWIHNDSPRILCNFSVYDCGLLTVTCTTSMIDDGTMRNDNHQMMQAWLLSPSSTCETKTDNAVHLIVTQCYQVHARSCHVNHGNACSLEYKVNTLSEVNKWVTSIHNVIQSLQDAVKLQQELQQEWKEEYQAVLMGYNTNVSRGEE
jgi:hypothetical protein